MNAREHRQILNAAFGLGLAAVLAVVFGRESWWWVVFMVVGGYAVGWVYHWMRELFRRRPKGS